MRRSLFAAVFAALYAPAHCLLAARCPPPRVAARMAASAEERIQELVDSNKVRARAPAAVCHERNMCVVCVCSRARARRRRLLREVLLFMKGSKLFPQCGFSNTAVQILNAIDAPYETFDVLADFDVREGVKAYSNWPTIPQCYIDGEFIGGCDVMIEMYQSGELQEMVEKANAS